MYIAARKPVYRFLRPGKRTERSSACRKFGIQYYKRPIALKGYFKFKAREVYTDEGEVQKDMKDRFDIYAILYEANENSFMLDGSNSLTSENIVAKAQISEEAAVETDEWTAFELPSNL